MANPPDLFAALEAAQQEIHEERRHLDAREAALQRAREDLAEALGGNGSSPGPRRRPRPNIKQKPAQHNVDAVHDYLARHGRARQADIGKALELNSGTVSISLRQLEEAGLVRPLPEKERASLVWEPMAPRYAEQRRNVATHA